MTSPTPLFAASAAATATAAAVDALPHTFGRRHLRMAWALLSALPMLAWAAPSIERLNTSLQGQTQVLRIELSEPLDAPPTGFTIQTPARIALDFPNTSSSLSQTLVELHQGNITTANVVQIQERTRVVLNLRQSTTYRTELEGKAVLVYLDAEKGQSSFAPAVTAAQTLLPNPTALEAAAASNAPQTSSPTTANSQQQQQQPPAPSGTVAARSIADVDFRRTPSGAGRIVVRLGSEQLNADIRQDGHALLVEFADAHLPKHLMRQLDVTDFATPVQIISASEQNGRVRLHLDLQGDWLHTAYQNGTEFVLEIDAKKQDPDKLTPGPGFSGERLTLNFQNIEVRALLQVIADFTGFNIITSDSVGGNLTLRLKDVPWDQALNIIMEAKGLGMKKNDNVLWIAPKEEIDDRTRKDLEAARAIEQLEPLRTQGFQINYAKAEDLVRKFTEGQNSGIDGMQHNRFLSNRGRAMAEERTNQIFVTDTPSKLEEIQELLNKLDIPVRQVLIEARIVEAVDSFGRSLGVKFGGGYNRIGRGSIGPNFAGANTSSSTSGADSMGSNSAGWDRNQSNSSSVGGSSQSSSNGINTDGNGINSSNSSSSSSSIVNNPFFNLPANALMASAPAAMALTVFNSGMTRFLSLELSAMESEGMGKIVSNPRLMTADKSEAEIKQGTQIPYKSSSGSGADSLPRVEFKDATLRLKVIPQITPDGDIIMDLEVNKDAIGIPTDDGPTIDTKSIKTQVLVENGGTIVIGGIFEMTESNQVNKVPFLGDLPGVGNLFKNKTRETEKREMLVFITPRVVSDAFSTN